MTLKESIDSRSDKPDKPVKPGKPGKSKSKSKQPPRLPQNPRNAEIFTKKIFGAAHKILLDQLDAWEQEYATMWQNIRNDPERISTDDGFGGNHMDPGLAQDTDYREYQGVPTIKERSQLKHLRSRFATVYKHQDKVIKFGLLLAGGTSARSAYLQAGFPPEGVKKAVSWAKKDAVKQIVRMACEAVVPVVIGRDCQLAGVDIMAGDHILEKYDEEGHVSFFPIAPALIEGAKRRILANAGVMNDDGDEPVGTKKLTVNFIQSPAQDPIDVSPVVDAVVEPSPVDDDVPMPAVGDRVNVKFSRG